MLARVLQKLFIPSVELRAVKFVRTEAGSAMALHIYGSEAWLRLLAQKLGKLDAVKEVELHGQRTGAGPAGG